MANKKEIALLRYKMFLEIWDENKIISNDREYVTCYETGKRIYDGLKNSSTIYHHVLHKSKYKEYDLCKWNIVLLTPDVHTQVHSNIDKTPKVKELTNKLMEKHKNDELNGSD